MWISIGTRLLHHLYKLFLHLHEFRSVLVLGKVHDLNLFAGGYAERRVASILVNSAKTVGEFGRAGFLIGHFTTRIPDKYQEAVGHRIAVAGHLAGDCQPLLFGAAARLWFLLAAAGRKDAQAHAKHGE
jgi:hypothetical protein